MKTEMDMIEMARSNAEMAVGQRAADMDTVAAYAQNVRDTLAEWGIATPRLVGASALHGAGKRTVRALAVYYTHVAVLLAKEG